LTRRLLAVAAGALGLAAATLAPAGDAVAPPSRTMAVTVDDLPPVLPDDPAEARRVDEGVLSALSRHGVRAVGFVNEGRLRPDSERAPRLALLEAWLEAGHDLGNHTHSHPDINRVPLEEFERDVLQGEPAVRALLAKRGRVPRWFRHPYTHTGPTREVRTAFETFLREHGYRVAPFTVENADYVFDLARRDASSRGDRAAAERLRAAYVDYTLLVVERMEALSRDTFGREIPQVLLVHGNRTNADALGEVLDRLAARGYRFVTLDEALSDEAWSTPDEFVGARGPSWLYRFRVAKGLALRLESEPDPPQWVLDLYREAQETR
jgi:peptidoglycan/xylan/chitin deacetylase (PgdA/CDA1 family)